MNSVKSYTSLFAVIVLGNLWIGEVQAHAVGVAFEDKSLTIGSSAESADKIIQVRPDIVDRHAQEIGVWAQRSKMLVRGAIGTVVGGIVVCGAWLGVRALHHALFPDTTEQLLSNAQQILDESKALEPIKQLQHIDQIEDIPHIRVALKKICEQVHALEHSHQIAGKSRGWGVKKMLISWAFQGANMLGFSAISTTAGMYLNNMLFETDVHWFVHKKTHLMKSLEHLQTFANDFDQRKTLPSYRVAHVMKAIPGQLNDVVAEFERLLGFLNYLAQRVTQQSQIMPQAFLDLPDVMACRMNSLCATTQRLLQDAHDGEPTDSMENEVKKFIGDLKLYISRYEYFDEFVRNMQPVMVFPQEP